MELLARDVFFPGVFDTCQVRRTAEGDVSVPITASYNHHYGLRITGASARFNKIMLTGPEDPRAESLMDGHGVAWDQPQYVVEQVKPSVSGHPVTQTITSGNGGKGSSIASKLVGPL